MAGATRITRAAYPTGKDGLIFLGPIGGYAIQGSSNMDVGSIRAPFDLHILEADLFYRKTDSNDIDDVRLETVDDSKKVVATADMSGDVSAVAQTVHSDMDGYVVQEGDIIRCFADTDAGSEGGVVWFIIGVKPVYG